MDLKLLWIIQLAPLAAFLIIQLLPNGLKKSAPLLGMLGALAAALASSLLFWQHRQAQGFPIQFIYPWLQINEHMAVVGFLLDRLNLLMIWLVTVIAFFIQLFSYYYMAEDKSRSRYFGFLSFFSFSMTGLVLSCNLLQTFLFWELVGLTSYLLIGFWFEKPSAATAARKAFTINRLGDLGFYLGIILLFLSLGTLNFTELTPALLQAHFSPQMITILGLLVFTGVMGKSAQFPFHNWLPDAMEGPTPVSALIHSATMVAAGVFLLSRAFGLFGSSQTTLFVVMTIGALTAFTGAALATIQRDIKKIMAYSTISQLGLMVMVIGAGSPASGMFHLTTHAFFKSLLFLTAGAFIHHHHTNDIWEIGQNGGKKNILPVITLLIGLASLCGLPPFSGFFSKDLILETLKEHNLFFYGVAIFVSFLTVYYSFRLLFVILLSKEKPHATRGHDHAHPESSAIQLSMALPLISLAAISVYMGYLGSPLNHSLLTWLGFEHEVHWNVELLLTTLGLIISGGAVAWWQFKNPEAAEKKLNESRGFVFTTLSNKFYIDDAYQFLVKKVGLGLAAVLSWFDRKFVNDVMVNGTSYKILDLGRLSSRLQSGLLQDYLSVALLVGVFVVFWVIR